MLSILIPAFNEDKILQESIDKVFNWSKKNSIKIELLVINNNSTDETESICKKNISNYKNFIYINELNKGKGFAVKSGLKNATYNKILILDADLSVSVDQFNTEWLNYEKICIAGSRYIGKVIGTPARRTLTGKAFSFLVKLLYRFSIDDTQCGFKYISYNSIGNIVEMLTIGNFAYDIDLLLAIEKANIEVLVKPVTYIHNNDSSVSIFKDSFKMLFTLIKLKIKYS